MRYVGGKSKLARGIATAILEYAPGREWYYEPFVGGASVFAEVAPHFRGALASDLHPDLIALWRGVTEEGFVPPEVVTEAEYQALKSALEPSAMRGYVGFGGSFGGKWFAGYARGGLSASGAPRNHQGESARAIMRIARRLELTATEFTLRSYDKCHPSVGDVVYCDPPYASTQGYATGAFDSARFWGVADSWVDRGASVFVSEYAAPEDWDVVWEASHRQSLVMPEQGRGLTVERLFHRVAS